MKPLKNRSVLLLFALLALAFPGSLPAQDRPAPPPAVAPPPAASEAAQAVANAEKLRVKDAEAAKAELSKVLTPGLVDDPKRLGMVSRKDPAIYEAAKLMGSLELQLGDPKKALKVYQQVFEAKMAGGIDDGEIYNRLGWASYKSGDYENAVKYFDQAIDTKETISRETREKAYNNLGQVYFEMGDLEASIEVYRKALKEFKSEFAEHAIKRIETFRRTEAARTKKLREAIAKDPKAALQRRSPAPLPPRSPLKPPER